MQKPTTAKGTRDFYGVNLKQKNYVLNVIREVFEKYGFEGLETPAIENLSTLTGKYGEEGDKLIFKILDSGDFLGKADEAAYAEKNSAKFSNSICSKALRYDLTIPFARFVAQNQNFLNFPFKRYQTQSVWRADRPQKGRFREFFQCDADCIGSDSIWQEIEFIHLYDDVFSKLNLQASLHLNNRKILYGLAESIEISKKFLDLTIALDKLDKIGKEGVTKELKENGIDNNKLEKIEFLFDESISSEEKLEKIKRLVQYFPKAKEGLDDLETIILHFDNNPLKKLSLKIDFTLARGLDYYTGCIFEAKVPEAGIGSVGAGGRYSNLTEIFGTTNLPGVGISFGLDRILFAMNELGVTPNFEEENQHYLFVNFGKDLIEKTYPIIQKMREKGYMVEFYPEEAKLKKQLQYAEKKNILFAIFYGEEEMQNKKLNIKNLKTGEQMALGIEEILATKQSLY